MHVKFHLAALPYVWESLLLCKHLEWFLAGSPTRSIFHLLFGMISAQLSCWKCVFQLLTFLADKYFICYLKWFDLQICWVSAIDFSAATQSHACQIPWSGSAISLRDLVTLWTVNTLGGSLSNCQNKMPSVCDLPAPLWLQFTPGISVFWAVTLVLLADTDNWCM